MAKFLIGHGIFRFESSPLVICMIIQIGNYLAIKVKVVEEFSVVVKKIEAFESFKIKPNSFFGANQDQ